MKKTIYSLLFLTFVLFACSPNTITPHSLPEQNPTNTPYLQPDDDPIINIPTVNAPSGPKIIVTVGTPNIGQGPDGNFPNTNPTSNTCAFGWAHPLLEELTEVFNTAITKVNPDASAYASAFGENCIYSDGRKIFLPIETDFYIKLPATNVADYEAFGNWIVLTMQIIDSLPPDMIEGPNSGFAEFEFVNDQNENLVVRVPLREYKETANGKTGESLFRLFYKQP
jgi:hypothetical protein